MKTHNTLKNRLIEKVEKLSIEQIQQVEHFIDTISQENQDRPLTLVSMKLSESVFATIWDNLEDADYDNL